MLRLLITRDNSQHKLSLFQR